MALMNVGVRIMGMGEMFTNKANFGGIADAPLKVSKVIQKAFIEVNEEGSEAAAATAARVVAHSISLPRPKITFTVNKPFFYSLLDTHIQGNKEAYLISVSKLSLFNGRVTEPKL